MTTCIINEDNLSEEQSHENVSNSTHDDDDGDSFATNLCSETNKLSLAESRCLYTVQVSERCIEALLDGVLL